VINRIALLVIAGLAPLALLLLWPKVRDHFTTAEMSLVVIRQPREEVLILGRMKRAGTEPFSLQTLLIEEPGKDRYRRLVSLDAENRFELTLGKPVSGAYRASLLLDKAAGAASVPEKWLTTPQLALDAAGSTSLKRVTAREYDGLRLLTAISVCAAVWIALLVMCARARIRPAPPSEPSPEQVSSG